jgi:hypothetical protein
MSKSRHAEIYGTVSGKWYVLLAEREYADRDEAKAYGPFFKQDTAKDFLFNGPHCNPGAFNVNEGQPEITESPGGSPILRPERLFGGWSVDYRSRSLPPRIAAQVRPHPMDPSKWARTSLLVSRRGDRKS